MHFDDEITDIEQFYYEPRQYYGTLVAAGCEVNLYIDQCRVDLIRTDLPIEWIKFGRMGREEGVLIIATKGFTQQIIYIKKIYFIVLLNNNVKNMQKCK